MSAFTRLSLVLSACVIALAVIALAVLSAAGAHADSTEQQELAAARAATAKYHDEAAALADGYLNTDECVASPDGAMGFHYVHPDLLGTPLDARTPPVLLYAPDASGERRLVALEYLQVDADQDPATDDDRPSLFGEPFGGPNPGHGDEMPVHYDLHVWLWKHNPDGMFADFNPAVSC